MSFGETYLYPPLKGKIKTPFNASSKHFGVDIQVMTSSIVTATLDGIIIFSNWTVSDDYVIQIQHSNNLISIYKGNSTPAFKTVGERVNAGEAIATVGSTSPTKDISLHFELWLNGVPLDPTIYIQF
jgi:murein DD-endopeptidase MepM/ murein hydrolase activator NlpD